MSRDESSARLAVCDAIICDLDGTLYLDGVPLPGALPFLSTVLESGRQLFYFTNNTSRSRRSYIEKLERLHFPVSAERIITAADCTTTFLTRQGLRPDIYLIGNRDLQQEFTEAGFDCWDEAHCARKLPRAVVLGFDTELTYAKIRTGYHLITAGVPYIATHADLLCPIAGGRFIPDVGSFISLFATATGGIKPVVMGKPHQPAVEAICARTGLPADKIAFIGDRLYTDIRMAMNFAMVGVLVLSGETSREMAAASPDQPVLIVSSVADLIPILRR
ncbi:MAG TPA: HAD-IIA family hydrolase [bacterium]|nr:HAD-IIA family hydrolase [bacterium]HPR86590.1 HAD-IIA family hydrolase [bacterium]